MIKRFDHLVIAVRDLDAALSFYRDMLGLDARAGGRHPGRGTRNGIVRFGLDYLELITVDNAEEAKASGAGGAELVNYLEQLGGGLVGYCLASDDLERLARHVAEAGLQAEGPFAMQRARPDGQLLNWQLLVPGGVSWRRPWPFFIRWGQPDDVRLSWERPGAHPLGATGVTGVNVLVRDLDQAVDLYGRQLGLPRVGEDRVDELAARRVSVEVGAFTIRLLAPDGPGALQDELAARGEGPYAVRLRVADLQRARDHLAGSGIELRPAPGDQAWLVPPELALGARFALE
jgi:catechol 2,3-dioxygenase-like lactoylglutathione lyase family enzyme